MSDSVDSSKATDWREGRRLRAFKLKQQGWSQQGWSQQNIARALGVGKSAVSQWMKRAREGGGKEALRKRSSPGARPRLSADQRARLSGLLENGAVANGFRGEVWTCQRVAQLIKREFGVGYHPAHVSRILKKLAFSLQKPDRLPDQRDEDAIEEWRQKRWPELKKGLSRRVGR
jgi:transposase